MSTFGATHSQWCLPELKMMMAKTSADVQCWRTHLHFTTHSQTSLDRLYGSALGRRGTLLRERESGLDRLKPKFHYADFATKSGTSSRQSRELVTDTNHESPQHKSRRRLSWFVSATKSRTFPMHCNGLNSIRATQTGLSWTCHGLCRKHLDMSRWFVYATFVICVGNFHRNFMVSWFVTVCVRDFHDLRPRLSPRGSFGESRHNGIWALGCTRG